MIVRAKVKKRPPGKQPREKEVGSAIPKKKWKKDNFNKIKPDEVLEPEPEYLPPPYPKASANNPDELLARELGQYANDPLGFVLFNYSWGEGELKGRELEQWQGRELEAIRLALEKKEPIRLSLKSGHGVGKTAFLGMVSSWAMSTAANARCRVTAHTGRQLLTSTMPEVIKWFQTGVSSRWWDTQAMSIKHKNFPDLWRLDAVSWSENSSTSFQGLHNLGGRTLIAMDEAAQIPEQIFAAAEGAINDAAQGIILAAGNPTVSAGAFFETFHKNRRFWRNATIDSRSVSHSNKALLQLMVDQNGEDSDYVKVRIKGEFPTVGESNLIDWRLVDAAMARETPDDVGAPIIIGVDVGAGKGLDSSVYAVRQGHKVCEIREFKSVDPVTFAAYVAKAAEKYEADAVNVDGVGIGYGCYSQLKAMRVPGVNDIQAGSTATSDPKRYKIIKDQMWIEMAEWLPAACLPRNENLRNDLINIQFWIDPSSRMRIEDKESFKKRGFDSPDHGEAVALTFALRVSRRDMKHLKGIRALSNTSIPDYSPFNWS